MILSAEERVKLLMAAESADEVLAMVRSTEPENTVGEKFTAVVSNPPYQDGRGNTSNRASSVWDKFIGVSAFISNKGSFVHPARWISGGKGTGLSEIRDYMLNSGHLHKYIVGADYEFFSGVGIGDVSVTYFDFLLKSQDILRATIENGILSEFSELIQDEAIDIPLSDADLHVTLKIVREFPTSVEQHLWVGGQDNKTKQPSSVLTGSVRWDYGIVAPRFKRDSDYFVLEDEIVSGVDYLKIHYLDGARNFGARYLPLDELQDTEKNRNRIATWQVLIPKTGVESHYRNLGPIAAPNELCTSSWLCRSFNTKQEVEGYQSYVKTTLYRYLTVIRKSSHNALANVHRFVPELENIKNPRTGLMGYHSDWTDDDLKELFKDVLTEDDWTYMRQVAVDADPAGKKMGYS